MISSALNNFKIISAIIVNWMQYKRDVEQNPETFSYSSTEQENKNKKCM